jgi:small-conductance mechanosensitive channel
MLAQIIGRGAQAAMASMGVDFHAQIGQAVRIVLLIATVIIAVQQLGIDLSLFSTALINLVTIAAAGMVLAFALGGQTVVRNILAGYYAKELFTPGDRMVIDGQSGVLEAIGTINTEISMGPDRLILPNTQLIEKSVVLQPETGPVDDQS